MIPASSLKTKTLAGVLIPFVCLIVFVLFQTSGIVRQLEKKVREELDTTIKHVEHDLSFHFKTTYQIARILSENDDIVKIYQEGQNQTLYRWGKNLITTGLASKVSFINEKDIVLARSHNEYVFNDRFNDPLILKKVRAKKGHTFLEKNTEAWYFASAIPVLQFDVIYKGFVLVEKKLSQNDLKLIAQGFGLDGIQIDTIKTDPAKRSFGSLTGGKDTAGKKGIQFSSMRSNLPDKEGGWPYKLTAYKDVGHQMARIQRLNSRILVLTLVLTFTAGGLIFWSIHYSLAPILKLHTNLNRFQSGQLSLSKLLKKLHSMRTQKNELGRIAESFIKTLDRIEDMQENLEDQVRKRTEELEEKTTQLSAEMKERKKAEKGYRLVVENATEAIFLIQNGRIKFPNPKTCELLGEKEEILSIKPFDVFIHPDSLETITNRNQQLLAGESVSNPVSFELFGPGKKRWVQLNSVFTLWEGAPATLNFLRDITELRKTQEILIQSEKMLSVGGLAAGMAHEINNPLAGMMQNAQVVLNRVAGDIPANEKAAAEVGVSFEKIHAYMEKRKVIQSLEQINQAGKQAAGIVKNMLSFSQKDISSKSTYDIRTILDETLELAMNDFDLKKKYDFRNIVIKKEYKDDIPPVLCGQSRIQQVVFNILKNAAEAMSEAEHKNEIKLTISACQNSEAVCIDIRDNGPGMDENTRKRVFEPFFTTKPVDKGTGLGLSVAYFIVVEDHGGRLEVNSELGKGACFYIQLPKGDSC